MTPDNRLEESSGRNGRAPPPTGPTRRSSTIFLFAYSTATQAPPRARTAANTKAGMSKFVISHLPSQYFRTAMRFITHAPINRPAPATKSIIWPIHVWYNGSM